MGMIVFVSESGFTTLSFEKNVSQMVFSKRFHLIQNKMITKHNHWDPMKEHKYRAAEFNLRVIKRLAGFYSSNIIEIF